MNNEGSPRTDKTASSGDDVTSPDDIIKQIGGCGRFQISMAVVIHSMKTVIAWSLIGQVFVLYTPNWRCGDTMDDGVFRSNVTGVTSVIHYADNGTNGNGSAVYWNKQCAGHSGHACQSVVFDTEPKTLVSKLQLVCDLAWVPSTIMSMQMAGLCAGNLLAGQIADIFGRKKPLFLSMLMLFAFNLTSAFSVNWLMFAVCRVLVGIGCGFFLSIQYNLMSEYTLSKWRSVIIGFPSYPLQISLFAFIAWLIQDWEILAYLTSAIALAFTTAWCLIPESFRWHIGHNRYTEAEVLIRRIAKFNRCPPPPLSAEGNRMSLVAMDTSEPDRTKYTIIDMFRTKEMLTKTLPLMICWFTVGFCMYGIGFGVQKLSGNIYLNIFLFNMASIPSKLITVFFQNRFGRKAATIIALSICGIGGLAVGILQNIDIDNREKYTNNLALAANVGVNMLWGPLQTLTVEIYPTVIRSLSFGFLSTTSRIGAILGPQMVYFSDLVPGLLYFAVALLCVLSTLGTLCLPETRDSYLQDKMGEPKRTSGKANNSSVV